MSDYRYTAVIATVSNSFCDAILDYSVNRFNYQKVLFLTCLVAFIGQVIIGLFTDISFTSASSLYIIIHAFLVLIGYICFIRSLEFIPIALVGLIETSSLFLTFVIDAIVGYVNISFYFISMLVLFIFSIFLFTENCLEKSSDCVKKIKPVGFVLIMLSVIFYLAAPYLIKISNHYGANEIAINLGYYFIAVPYFCFQYLKSSKNIGHISIVKTKCWNNLYVLCLIIGSLETLYYIFETFSFINDAPTIVIIIEQMRIFLLFILSVIFGTDKFTIKKFIALILGSISVTGLYFG